MIFRLKGSLACHHLEHSNSERPHIDHLIVSPTLEYLRCPIERSSCWGQHISFTSSLFNLFADSKVNQLNTLFVFVIEYIFWFDIAMADLFLVNIPQGYQHLENDAFEFIFGVDFNLFEAWERKVIHHKITP